MASPTLRVRVLGAGAGGGLPQWNCACDVCLAARAGEIPARTQSSIAVTADGERWLLVNASPDVRHQVQFLAVDHGRGSRIDAIALTSADVDHVAGLLVLREGGAPPIYATPETLGAITTGLSVLPTLGAYGPVDARTLETGRRVRFAGRDGRDLGIVADVVDVGGKPPLYIRASTGAGEGPGNTIALVLRATRGDAESGAVVYAPGLSCIPAELTHHMGRAAALLVDGTCFTDDELSPLGGRTSLAMGHLPVGGAGGTLVQLAPYRQARRVFVHVNNTNPMFRSASRERAAVEAAGFEVGQDGMEVVV